MQKVTVTLAIEGVDPMSTDAESLLHDFVADHLTASGKPGYNVLLLDAKWDSTTIEYRAAQMSRILLDAKTLESQCYASKPSRREALEMGDQAKELEELCEDVMKNDVVKKSVDLTAMGNEIFRRCAAISEHVITIAHPSRKETQSNST
jgi:hypothetical protein